MNERRELWWLNPAWVTLIMGTGLAIAAYMIPESMYRTYWFTPKYFNGEELRITLAFIAMFCFGAMAGAMWRSSGTVESEAQWMDRIPWTFIQRAFNACFYLSLIGYLAWGGAAVSRGATLDLVIGVLHGDKGASYVMKETYLGTISGVTTLTQLAIVCLLLAVLIGVAKGWRPVLLKCGILFLVTLVRALMNSERLALMELMIPAVILVVRLVFLESERFTKGRIWTLLRGAPVFGYLGLTCVFGASEYFRSWINFYAGGNMSFWQFVSARLLGYYVTALNNGALLTQRIDPTGAPFFTLHMLFRFPLFSNIADALWPNIAFALNETDPYMRVLAREANPEFNNGSGFLIPILDFGFAGSMLYWLAAGLICGILYRMFQQNRITGLLLYPVTFVGVIELTRIIYWAEGRVFVPICVLIVLALVCGWYARRYRFSEEEAEWQPSH